MGEEETPPTSEGWSGCLDQCWADKGAFCRIMVIAFCRIVAIAVCGLGGECGLVPFVGRGFRVVGSSR